MESLTAIISALHEREKPSDMHGNLLGNPPAAVKRTLNAPGQIRYLGFGREMLTSEKPFGLYARGIVRGDNRHINQELHLYYIDSPDAQGIRQSIGHVGLLVRTNAEVVATAHTFEELDPASLEAVVGPIGPWAVTAVSKGIQDRRNMEASTTAQALPPTEPLDMANQDFAPLAAFIADPLNREAYHRFSYQDGYANGLVVAQA
jgi:hypothetical protein